MLSEAEGVRVEKAPEFVAAQSVEHPPAAMPPLSAVRSERVWLGLLAVIGPGLVVMLADTDAGSVVTAAQSGAQWGYGLILPQLLLIPVLFLIQEVTVRLAVVTRQGHGALIRRHCGRRWAVLAAVTLLVACIGALVTEFAGIAGAGRLAGISPRLSVPAAALALGSLCVAGRYRRVELVAVTLGLLELFFIPAALLAHPRGIGIAHGLHTVVLRRTYLMMVAANVGAVVMPWMIFYQQQAVVDKGIGRRDLRLARADTAIGSVLTQAVMIAIVVATAATIGRSDPGASLATIGQIAAALTPFLGPTWAPLFFGLGMLGAAVVAALVVALAGAWGISEVLGWRHSLNDRLRTAWPFYLLCAGALLVSGGAVIIVPDLVALSLDVQVLNAALLPVVLGFLLVLERRALPERDRMRGAHKWLVWSVAAVVMSIGLFAALNSVGALVL